MSLLYGLRDDGPDDGGFATFVGVPNLGHADRDGFPGAVHVVRFALFGFGPVKEHFLHPVLRGIAHVDAQQVVGFACRHAIFRRPCIMDGLEHFQFDYHFSAFLFLPRSINSPRQRRAARRAETAWMPNQRRVECTKLTAERYPCHEWLIPPMKPQRSVGITFSQAGGRDHGLQSQSFRQPVSQKS